MTKQQTELSLKINFWKALKIGNLGVYRVSKNHLKSYFTLNFTFGPFPPSHSLMAFYNHKVFTCVASKSKSQSLIGRNYPYCCIMGIMWLRQLQELFHIWFALKVEIYFLADRILSSFHWNSAAFTLFLVSHVRSFKAGLIGLCRWLSALHIEDQLTHLSSLRCSSWECVHESTRQSCDMISVKLSQYVVSTPKLKQAN